MSDVTVGTPEWDALTERRAMLIRKKNRGGLTADEAAEFERLQQESRAAISAAFPSPPSILGKECVVTEKGDLCGPCRRAIERSLEDIKRGRLVSHEDVGKELEPDHA